MLSEYIVAESLADGSLIRLLPDYTVEERKLYVVYQPDPHQPAAVRAFVDFLVSHVEDVSKSAPAKELANAHPKRI